MSPPSFAKIRRAAWPACLPACQSNCGTGVQGKLGWAGHGTAWPGAGPPVSARVCARAQRGASGTAALQPGSRDPFYATA